MDVDLVREDIEKVLASSDPQTLDLCRSEGPIRDHASELKRAIQVLDWDDDDALRAYYLCHNLEVHRRAW